MCVVVPGTCRLDNNTIGGGNTPEHQYLKNQKNKIKNTLSSKRVPFKIRTLNIYKTPLRKLALDRELWREVASRC